MSFDLTFVRATRVLKFEGSLHDILRSISDREWKEPDCDAIAVHVNLTGDWYLFEPRIFFQRAREFFDLAEFQQTLANFENIFEIHELRKVLEIRLDVTPNGPAVVLSPLSNDLQGAWIKQGPNQTRRWRGMRGDSSFELAADVAKLSKDDLLLRTPHMDFSPAPPIAPAGDIDVEVFTDIAAPTQDEESEQIKIPSASNEYLLSVWLARSEELDVLGPSELPLRIVGNEERSSSARFRVKVKSEAPPGRLATLTASFSYKGRPCGRVTRTLLIGETGNVRPTREGTSTRDFAGSVQIEREPPPAPDLTILVACPDGEPDRYQVRITTALVDALKGGVAGPWKLSAAAGDLVRTKMAKFATGGISNSQRLDNLLGAGRELFAAAPELFRSVFWDIIRCGAPLRTILILSEEPHIPWELMVPDPDPANDTGRAWKPLGVEFAMGRWVHEGHISPPGAVSLMRACVVAPDYAGSEQAVLQSAAAECEYVRQVFGGAALTPARYGEIRNRIEAEMAPLLHFVGHGHITPEGEQQFCLEQNETLSATEVRGMNGFRQAVREVRPMVFLNACEVGRPIPAFVGAGGFPLTFMQLGASAVIAPLWSVRDSCAHEVAVALYDAVRQDARVNARPRSVAEILRTIRARTYAGNDEGEDSYAAYCFYGDPSFVLQLPSRQVSSSRRTEG